MTFPRLYKPTKTGLSLFKLVYGTLFLKRIKYVKKINYRRMDKKSD